MVHEAGTFASLTTNDNIKIGIDDNINEVRKEENFQKDGWLEREIYSAYSLWVLSWWSYNIRTSVAGVLTRHGLLALNLCRLICSAQSTCSRLVSSQDLGKPFQNLNSTLIQPFLYHL